MPVAVTRSCENCGDEFRVEPSRPNKVFCSMGCKMEGRAAQVTEMLPAEAAWMAGIADGEGCVEVRYRNRKTGADLRYARLSVVNTHLPMLQRCQEWTGVGTVIPVNKNKPYRKEHWKQSWVWVVQGVQAAAVLRQLEPWLLEKRERAREAIAAHAEV
jgi:hypothetical protein